MEHGKPSSPTGASKYNLPATPEAEAETGRGEQPLKIVWVVIFLLNLPLPLFFGWGTTKGAGRIGMFLALPILLGIGYRVCDASRWHGTALTVGGVLVAISQLFPAFQIFAGLFGLVFAQSCGLVTPRFPSDDIGELHGLMGGLLVTLMTGGILMASALIVGAIILGIRSKLN